MTRPKRRAANPALRSIDWVIVFLITAFLILVSGEFLTGCATGTVGCEVSVGAETGSGCRVGVAGYEAAVRFGASFHGPEATPAP